MSTAGPRTISTGRAGLSSALLGAAIVFFSLTTDLPWYAAFTIAGTGVVAAVVLRARSAGTRSDPAALIVLLSIGVLAGGAAPTRLAGAAGGLTILAFLLWLADEPGRVEGAVRRALPAVGLAGLAFGISWMSAFLLPSTPQPIGIAGGLLVLVIFLAAVLLGRPELFRREPPLTDLSALE
jgi:hypothetical protein